VYGIPVFTDDGERIGQSTSAARKAIAQVVMSRVFMATPGMCKFCCDVTFIYFCSWSMDVLHSGVQLSSCHGAVLPSTCHSACYWSNVVPSTAVCIVIRCCGASNTSFIAWRQSLCGCWNSL